MEKKIKLLLVPSDIAGVGHFRTIWPAQQINKDYPNEFEIEINPNPNTDNIEYLTKFDIIHFHRQLGRFEKINELFPKLKEKNIKLIMDIDDYWNPSPSHPLYAAAQKEQMSKKTVEFLRQSDYVTTTTSIFADYIKPYNKNVFVMPNALDTEHKMWQNKTAENLYDKCRINIICGSSHLKDLEILKPSINMLINDQELTGKYQLVLCGYDIRGTITEISQDGTQQRTRKIQPHETVWNRFEEIMTNNYNPNIISENYKKWLHKCKNEPYAEQNINELNYIRRWTLPLTQYGKHYDYCDVLLAPLEENIFNEVKSPLKYVEAGMRKKVLISQEYGIHKYLIKNWENGILIPKANNTNGWYKAMRKLILDKELRNKISNNLHECVKDEYSLKNVCKNRINFYKEIL